MAINTKDISKMIDTYKSHKSSLIAVLQDIQGKYNWLPPEALCFVAEQLCVPLVDVYSVATFYRAFSLVPRGKHCLTICMGTACHVRGAPQVLNRFEELLGIKSGGTTPDHNATLEEVMCLGCCALAPVVVVDGKYHGGMNIQKAEVIVNDTKPKPKTTKPKTIKKTAKKK
jgi:NADH-quinone oxidoreductase subunit E